MDTFGQHLLVEYHGCDPNTLNDLDAVERLMVSAATSAGATVVSKAFHRFTPQGVSGVVLIAESHMSIHTWPEHGYAAVDFYTCGDCVPEQAHEQLRTQLQADRSEVLKVQRGTYPPGPSMTVAEHYREGREHPDAEFVPEQIDQR